MTSEITYDLLWQLVQKERQTNELQLLPKTFYEDANAMLARLDRKDLTEEEINTKKNAMRLLSEMHDKRKQKILIYVAYKKQIPQPVMQVEQEFYNELVEIANRNRLDLKTPKDGRQAFRSLQAIPEIILPSGRKAGPFEKDQIVEMEVDEEDTKFLVANTICRKL